MPNTEHIHTHTQAPASVANPPENEFLVVVVMVGDLQSAHGPEKL